MGKRKHDGKPGKNGNRTKKFKIAGFIDPNTSGIYATCNRGKERGCVNELTNLFNEKAQEYYNVDELNDKEDEKSDESEKQPDTPKELSIEEQIKQEVDDLKQSKHSKTSLFTPIELDCECLIFIKTRTPIEPEDFVKRICQESYDSKQKSTRYTQKLTPITYSVSPSLEEVKKLAQKVLAPHFHNQQNQPAYKFAIQVTRRNFNAIEKGSIIKTVAECVGRDHGHSVDLKNYEKLILIECYKTNVGMCVVDKNYDKYFKFNLQQLYEKTT